jgi:hypothetical protein
MRKRQTPITLWILRKKGLKPYSDFIAFYNLSLVFDPFFKSEIFSLNFYKYIFSFDANEFSLVALDYFSACVFVRNFIFTDFYRFDNGNGIANYDISAF